MMNPRLLPNGNLLVPVNRNFGKNGRAEALREIKPGEPLYREWLPIAQKGTQRK